MQHWQLAATLLGLLAYAVAGHWLMVHAPNAPWAVVVLFGPLLLALGLAGWRGRRPLLVLLALACAAVLAGVVWRGGVADVQAMYVLQHAALHGALGAGFAITLRTGGTPLITQLAQRLHGAHFTPAMARYTRGLTQLWAAYFAAMIVLSLAIYASLPWAAWSLFCNFITPAAPLLLGLFEHTLRYRRHPEFHRATMLDGWRAWQQHGAAQSSPPAAPQ